MYVGGNKNEEDFKKSSQHSISFADGSYYYANG